MKMTGLAAGALVAAVFAFPAPSQAQVLGDIFGGGKSRAPRDDRSAYGDAYRTGHDRGYQDGLDRGAKGRSAGSEQDLARDPRYREGDAGYKKEYGARQDYIAGYRDGYEQAVLRGGRAGEDVRGGGRGASRRDPSERDDPYDYGRDRRYGDRDERRGTQAGDRSGSDDRNDDRIEPSGRNDDGYDDDVIYEQ